MYSINQNFKQTWFFMYIRRNHFTLYVKSFANLAKIIRSVQMACILFVFSETNQGDLHIWRTPWTNMQLNSSRTERLQKITLYGCVNFGNKPIFSTFYYKIYSWFLKLQWIKILQMQFLFRMSSITRYMIY